MERQRMLQNLACIFSYPQAEYKDRAEQILIGCQRKPRLTQYWRPFVEFVRENDLATIEETFTRTFDMRPSTCLEVGWHLYGEDYKRGQFLVKMRQTLARHRIPETVELPDHISHCLNLLAALPDDEACTLLKQYIKPALLKILAGFEPENPYRFAVHFLDTILYELYRPSEVTKPMQR